jgi:hypothetical protein
MKSQEKNKQRKGEILVTDLIIDFEWCSVLIVASLLKLLVSQICIVHSSAGDALKYTQKCEQYYMCNKICTQVLISFINIYIKKLGCY